MVDVGLLDEVHALGFGSMRRDPGYGDRLRDIHRRIVADLPLFERWRLVGYDTFGRNATSKDLGRIVLGWRPTGFDTGPSTFLTVERAGEAGFGGAFEDNTLESWSHGRYCAYRVD